MPSHALWHAFSFSTLLASLHLLRLAPCLDMLLALFQLSSRVHQLPIQGLPHRAAQLRPRLLQLQQRQDLQDERRGRARGGFGQQGTCKGCCSSSSARTGARGGGNVKEGTCKRGLGVAGNRDVKENLVQEGGVA